MLQILNTVVRTVKSIVFLLILFILLRGSIVAASTPFNNPCTLSINVYPDLVNQISIDQIRCGSEIGSGSCGHVFDGFWNDHPVAIKVLCFKAFIEREVRLFHDEISLMWRCRGSDRILRLYGYCMNNDQVWLILEKMHMSLYQAIHNELISDDQRFQIACDIAEGLDYLHSRSPEIVHRDIKSANILLDEYGRAKIGDFGIAKICGELTPGPKLSEGPGTMLWCAPEVLALESATPKSDIYSYGMVLWELLTKREPFNGVSNRKIKLAIIDGKCEQIPENTDRIWRDIIKSCWNKAANLRPSAKTILELLQTYLWTSQKPPIKMRDLTDFPIFIRDQILRNVEKIVNPERQINAQNIQCVWINPQKSPAHPLIVEGVLQLLQNQRDLSWNNCILTKHKQPEHLRFLEEYLSRKAAEISDIDRESAPSSHCFWRPYKENYPENSPERPSALQQNNKQKLLKLKLKLKYYHNIILRHTNEYNRFCRGRIIYKKGKIEEVVLPFSQLSHPFMGTFDLSALDYSKNFIKISTGIKDSFYASDKHKVEIWIVPRYLAEFYVQNGVAKHFAPILAIWPRSEDIGIFWTRGSDEDFLLYCFCLKKSDDFCGNTSLLRLYLQATVGCDCTLFENNNYTSILQFINMNSYSIEF